MADIATLKELQAGLNASFEAIYNAPDAKTLAGAKEALVGLSHATAGVALGPAFLIMSLTGMPVHYMAVKIATELSLFEIISQRPHSLSELAQITGANSKLLKRILRMVTAIGWLKQTESDIWEASQLTLLAAVPALKSWLIVHFESRMHIYAEFPDWLRRHKYQTSWVDDKVNIFKDVNGLDCWSYMTENPDYSTNIDTAMSIQESFPPEMTPPYPFAEGFDQIKQDEHSITLVDIGGGAGQAIESIKKTYPELSGRFVLQDLPKTIEKLDVNNLKNSGIDAQSHDFFTEQPVKSAKYYHLRRVLHDWNDEKCLEILKATKPAMIPAYSKLLIVEFVLPDVSPGPLETQVDLMMMTCCDGAERSVSEWHVLLEKAGFKIDRILRADAGTTAVIEASVV